MTTVACVLRSGGIYGPEHVHDLRDAVLDYLPEPHEFVCLTDAPSEVRCDAVPLLHDWPGWWSKVELFRPTLTGRILYFDLDTAIVGDLSDLAGYDGEFAMIGDFGDPSLGASGVMAWVASERLTRDVYEAFARSADGAMAGRRISGDQDWIRGAANDRWDDLRALYPGQIEPWNRVGPDARVVCWYGEAKPWNAPMQRAA